jgi:hypothetical protein
MNEVKIRKPGSQYANRCSREAEKFRKGLTGPTISHCPNDYKALKTLSLYVYFVSLLIFRLRYA